MAPSTRSADADLQDSISQGRSAPGACCAMIGICETRDVQKILARLLQSSGCTSWSTASHASPCPEQAPMQLHSAAALLAATAAWHPRLKSHSVALQNAAWVAYGSESCTCRLLYLVVQHVHTGPGDLEIVV